MSAVPDAGAQPNLKSLEDIEVAKIDRNPNNPRIHFTEEELDRLSQSVDEKGILVPVVVYPDPDGDGYRLIDGERRWLVAQTLGLEKIPAVITDPPDPRDNLLQMFNIHMVREAWQDMPTAWALRDLMKETGELSDRGLSDITGLSVERIRRLRHALDLPKEYQEYIDDGSIPLNFFWELKENVIDPLARRRPVLWEEFEEGEVLKAFVDKRLQGVISNVVALRNVRAIIATAEREADSPTEPSDLDDTLRQLVREPDATIEDAYQDTVEVTVETDKLERRTTNMVKSFARLLRKVRTPEERDHVKRVGQLLIESITDLIR